MLVDGLAIDGHTCLKDGSGLSQRHGITLDAYRVIDMLEVSFFFGPPQGSVGLVNGRKGVSFEVQRLQSPFVQRLDYVRRTLPVRQRLGVTRIDG